MCLCVNPHVNRYTLWLCVYVRWIDLSLDNGIFLTFKQRQTSRFYDRAHIQHFTQQFFDTLWVYFGAVSVEERITKTNSVYSHFILRIIHNTKKHRCESNHSQFFGSCHKTTENIASSYQIEKFPEFFFSYELIKFITNFSRLTSI